MACSVVREDDYLIVRIPMDEAQSLRVALQPCLCKHTKSAKTAAIRERFVRGLGMAMFSKGRKSDEQPQRESHEAPS